MREQVIRTVNGNSDALSENVAILTDEGRDLAELVDLEILSRNTFSWLSLDDLEVDVVGLGNCANGS